MNDLKNKIYDVIAKERIFDAIFVYDPDERITLRFDEGTWIKINSPNSIRVDHPTHGVGQKHAHVYGRKGQEIGVINLDGTASHGKKMRLTGADADALRAKGFVVPADRFVEWIVGDMADYKLLFG